MALRLRTTAIRTLVVLGIGVFIVEMLVVQRIEALRDLQRSLIRSQQQALMMERDLHPSTLVPGSGDSAGIQATLDRSSQLLAECCVDSAASLLASNGLGEGDNYAEAYGLLQTDIDRFLSQRQTAIEQAIALNQWLPWGFFAILVAVLALAWRILQKNFLGPIVRLHGAVRRADQTGTLAFTSRAVDPSEIEDLAVSFDNLLTRLSGELAGRELALREAREMARRESDRVSAELTELIDGSPSPIFSLNLEGNVTNWNRKIAAVSGLHEREAKGCHFAKQCLRGSDQPVFERHFLSVLGGGAVEEFQLTVMSTTGAHSLLLASLTPRRSYGGDIIGVTCFGQPLGDFLLQTVHSVEQQRSTQFSELASSAAHQLNQPLQKMRLFLANAQNRLRVEPLDKSVLAEKLAGVDEQLSAVSEIIDHLREFGRPIKPVPGGFQLATVIDRCVQLSRGSLVERGIRVVFENSLTDEVISGHPLQIEKPLIALINNARDAIVDGGPQQGEVHIRAQKTASGVVQVSVSDNGSGISSDLQGRIFEPFFTTRDGGGNVGLGLSVAKAMVEGLGGTLELSFQADQTVARIDLRLDATTEESERVG